MIHPVNEKKEKKEKKHVSKEWRRVTNFAIVFSRTIDNNGKTCSLITPFLNSNGLTYSIKMLLAAALKVYDSNREWNLIAPLFVSLLKSHFRDRLNRITFLPRFFKLPFNYHSGKLWISYRLLAAGPKSN